MGEELDPELPVNAETETIEDPLAELARIVAGEPEPDDAPITEDKETNSPSSGEAAEAVVEDAKETMLSEPETGSTSMTTGNAADVQAVEDALSAVEQELNISSSADMETAIAEMPVSTAAVDEPVQTEDEAVPAATGESVPMPSAPEQSGAPVDIEHSFQDDLINALQEEIGQPASAPVATEAVQSAPVDDEPVAAEPEAAEPSFEDAIMGDLQAALDAGMSVDAPMIEEPAAPLSEEIAAPEIDHQIPQTASVAEEAVAEPEPEPEPEPVLADPAPFEPDAGHSVSEPPYSDDPSPVLADEDLGAAFANEFEQLQTQAPQPADYKFEDIPAEPAITDESDPAAPEAEAGVTSMDELDFGTAFAEELGVDSVTEAHGWGADETAAAHADFSDAVQAGAHFDETPNGLEQDPGHVGIIPETNPQAAEASAHQEERSGSRKYALVAMVIALLAGSAVTVYGFLGGGEFSSGGSAPILITADAEPFKVTPDDPGGRVAPNQDKASYERVAGEDTEKVDQASLISKTEEPVRLDSDSSGGTEEPAPATNLAEKTDERLAVNQNNEQADTNSSATVTPRVVQTVTVKPDGTIVTGTRSSNTQDAATQVQQAVSNGLQAAGNALSDNLQETASLAESVVATPKPVETITIKKADPIDGAISTGALAVPEASPLPKPAPKPAAVANPEPVQVASNTQQNTAQQPVAKSEYVVQVSSQRSPEAAQASFQNLRNRFSQLQGRAMSIQKANVNGATFYRVRVQTASRQDANELCGSLQASGGSCFVTR